jgi:hypothetical protein
LWKIGRETARLLFSIIEIPVRVNAPAGIPAQETRGLRPIFL